jgi:hypothetical protein
LKLSPMSSASRPIWYDGCAMEKLFARRLDMSRILMYAIYIKQGMQTRCS